ncbi:cyclin-dependent protein kinase inhibitor [Cyathus striatus]|nr:cyclin-dependent protein kinase inhibitor [Cyathus striatus]
MEFFNDIGSDPLKPSLFELVAQEQLRDLLQPALKYVLAVFAQRYPRYLLRVVNRHEEFYAGIMLIVERYYLRKHNASFAENFYGLKRRKRPYIETERSQAAVGGIPAGETLKDREIWRSLLFLVGIPYLRAKAHDYFEELGGVNSDILDDGMDARQLQALTDTSPKGRLRRAFKAAYPWLNASFELWLLLWNIAYLFNQTPFYRPWLRWVGVDLRRLGVEDFRAAGLAVNRAIPSNQRIDLASRLKRAIRKSPRLLLDSLRLLLPSAIFFIKFLEWWYSPNSPARSLSSSPLGPAIPPPKMLPPHPKGIPFDRAGYGICPLCQKSMNNATALPSGYVFCYRCAYDYVEKHGRCPVTLLPTRIWQLRKVLRRDFDLVRLNSASSRISCFGKQIQAQQVPGWSAYYLDYKFLKKIISSLAANRPASEAAALALNVRPPDTSPAPQQPESPGAILRNAIGQPPIFPSSADDNGRGPNFQAHKAAFFFKLERELEKAGDCLINAFYLQKEAELRLRMETLLSKRRAAAMRGLPDTVGDPTQVHAEWSAVEEGFRLLERDLGKLQQFIEINATGFRKILKKYDKRSTSTTKELYLARQVDVQPVFNRQLISEMADTVATCLLDLTDLSSGLKFEGSSANDIFTQQILSERALPSGPFRDLENNLHKAIATSDAGAIRDCVHFSEVLSQQNEGKATVSRILWNVIIEAPPDLADLILSSVSSPFDYHFVDDINGRTCLHEAAMAGALRLVNLCIENGVQVDKCDLYGRTALHYASMNGHSAVCRRLLEVNVPPNILDRDNYSPLVYATLKGNVDCVRVLLEQGNALTELSSPLGDLIPLSLACQSGHVDVVVLLLQHGARCLPNTNGEYPMHLAAREGHAAVCKLLLHLEGWDTPDKYHEWTPLFHAARYGHDECVELLLNADCRIDAKDELGHIAAHYAAWYGYQKCLAALLSKRSDEPSTSADFIASRKSPLSEVKMTVESEIDLIPSLSLPPPIMPHRVYGHNYLDKNHLIKVYVGRCAHRASSGIRLHHRLISPAFRDEYLVASTPLKLVMTTTTHVTSAPYSISLPQKDEDGVFVFQIPSLDTLSLEFSIYPNFGTKTIGRAVALPSVFVGADNNQLFTLPILDTRLHVVGEVDFDITIINSFHGVTLDVGGGLETYWKSTAATSIPPPHTGLSRDPRRPSRIGSAHTSPAVLLGNAAGSQALTLSSLQGDYIYLVVQVTRDFYPVIFGDWFLPVSGFDLKVSDVTLEQFETLSQELGRNFDVRMEEDSSRISNAMLSLDRILVGLPTELNLCLELAYPSETIRSVDNFGSYLGLNDFVDSVLKSIYHCPLSLESPQHRRRILFTSFSPDICAALNWKQPNYPVFFASHCGNESLEAPSITAYGSAGKEKRVSSIGGAVEFAKANNLLGIFVDGSLLTRVPSLADGIRSASLLIGIIGSKEKVTEIKANSETSGNFADAVVANGVVSFINHSISESM